ncbi:hypothetical protein P4204_27330 [Pseudomonas aeruginosa]|nr:hypothetical protein [Pseudomonas aeruginosa]
MSNLQIPGFEQPWEVPYGKPERIVTALDIMVEARWAAPRSTTSSAVRR